jgi:hypothetical protein
VNTISAVFFFAPHIIYVRGKGVFYLA